MVLYLPVHLLFRERCISIFLISLLDFFWFLVSLRNHSWCRWKVYIFWLFRGIFSPWVLLILTVMRLMCGFFLHLVNHIPDKVIISLFFLFCPLDWQFFYSHNELVLEYIRMHLNFYFLFRAPEGFQWCSCILFFENFGIDTPNFTSSGYAICWECCWIWGSFDIKNVKLCFIFEWLIYIASYYN